MEENIATHCNIVGEEERLGAWITDQNADAIPPQCVSELYGPCNSLQVL